MSQNIYYIHNTIHKFYDIKNCCVLNENSPQLEFDLPNIKLYQHQKTLLYQINEMEQNVELDNLNEIVHKIQSNIGVICDMVGSGKTYTILSQIFRKLKVDYFKFKLITSKPLIYNKVSKNFHIALMKKAKEKKVLSTNFIVVPNTVYTQWVEYIKKFLINYPNVSIKYIFGKKSLNNDVEKEIKDILDEKYNIIIASSNYWNLYYKKYLSNIEYYIETNENEILFSRMIIDEIDTIDIGKRSDISMLPCCFYWFISSNYENLFYPNGRRKIIQYESNENSSKMKNYELVKGFAHTNYLKNFFCTFDVERFTKIFIYNDPIWIHKSIQIPNITNIEYYASDILEDHIDNLIKYGGCEKIVNYLNSNDWEGLSNYTNCNVKNPNDLYTFLAKELEIQIENRKSEIEYRKKIIPITQREQNDINTKVEKLEEQCKSLEIRKETIKNNIDNVDKDQCPICVDTIVKPIFVRCCYHHFCSECLMNNFKHTKNTTCPLCRQEINNNNMFFVNEKSTNITDTIQKNKFEILYEILEKKNFNDRILIFIDKISLYDKFLTEFKEKNIPFNILNGSIYKINNVILKYNSGEIPILLLNATSYGTGLNLQNTTDIILFNRMDRCLESQIIGRAQRIGRTNQLKLHYIMYRNEKHLDKSYFDNGLFSIEENLDEQDEYDNEN